MALFRFAHAQAEDWAHAAQACVDGLGRAAAGANLGFVYATDLLADDLGSILVYLRQRTGIAHWVGSVGLGICGGGEEYFDVPALAVMTAALPENSFHVFTALNRSADELAAAARAWIAAAGPAFGVVHGDPRNVATPAVVRELAGLTSGFLIGGLTSSRGPFHQVAGRLTGGGVSGVLFGPGVTVATGLSQGCQPLGPVHTVSDAMDNVLMRLDERPALDVFKEDIGAELAGDLRQVAGNVHAALPVAGSDTGDYTVRNLLGIDTRHGWLAIGERLSPGDRVLFVRRDPPSAETDLAAMVERIKGRLDGPPKAGLYFSCVARGAAMFGRRGREAEIIRRHLGDFPLVGFYAGGEISNARLYGYTGVLAVFL
jgi:small ligand-binding sensory domain FIST